MKQTILDYLRNLPDFHIQSPCNGNHTCGKCIVHVVPVLEINEYDQKFLSTEQLEEGFRISCSHEYQKSLKITTPVEKSMTILTSTVFSETILFKQRNEYGIVIDIGTTTVVIKLIKCDGSKEEYTRSFFNPQTSYGNDVISRIKAANEGNLVNLTRLIVDKIELNILALIAENNVDFRLLTDIVITGNTTMIYLLLGKSPEKLGFSPFIIEPFDSYVLSILSIFKNCTMFAGNLLIVPYLSAFIGGDILGGIVACGMDKSDKVNLLIDLGTNGEMVIGNENSLITLSTAAGPAFEGGNIDCGSISVDGAISKIQLLSEQIALTTINNSEPIGICGTGLISIIAEMVKNGIIDETGRFSAEIDNYMLFEKNNIYLSQKDIREFQLAKAAIQTGIITLIKSLKLSTGMVNKVFISGGFGVNLSVDDFIVLGIIPREFREKIIIMDNSSLSGAIYLLLTKDIDRFKSLELKAKNINLAETPDFYDLFVDSMFFNSEI